jgi:hypothetical protein
MSMSCRGRPGTLCGAKFCLWCVYANRTFALQDGHIDLIYSGRCMKIPKAVKIMGPNASRLELSAVAHEHAFECRSRCPAHNTPGKSSLYPTEDIEKSEWIVAWHAMKTIEKALSFLRTNVSVVTRDAVLECPEVAKMFEERATIVRDRLQARPQDSASLHVPEISADSDIEEPMQPIVIDDDDDYSEEDDDDVWVLGQGRPRHQVQGPLQPAAPAAHRVHSLRPLPPPSPPLTHKQDLPFADAIDFVMAACQVNRRAAIDALDMHGASPEAAVMWLLQGWQ